jgi:hypothetical protein
MMKMVLGRARPDDRLGLMVETLFRVRDGAPRDTIVLRFRKAPKGDKSEYASATLAEINYCPWCGHQIRRAGRIVRQ